MRLAERVWVLIGFLPAVVFLVGLAAGIVTLVRGCIPATRHSSLMSAGVGEPSGRSPTPRHWRGVLGVLDSSLR